MLINIVNPNTTASMTAKIGAAARAVAAPGTEILAVNPIQGPASIEGYYDEAMSLPGMLAEIGNGEAAGADAHIIACFDDTGWRPPAVWRTRPSSASARRRFTWRA